MYGQSGPSEAQTRWFGDQRGARGRRMPLWEADSDRAQSSGRLSEAADMSRRGRRGAEDTNGAAETAGETPENAAPARPSTPPQFKPVMSGGVSGAVQVTDSRDGTKARLQSPTFSCSGSASVTNSGSTADWELGILQTITKSKRVGVYTTAANNQDYRRRKEEAKKKQVVPGFGPKPKAPSTSLRYVDELTALPCRDRADENSPAPWYFSAPTPFAGKATSYSSANDAPNTLLPWKSKDGAHELFRSGGRDKFYTYVVAHNKKTDERQVLAHMVWLVTYDGTIDVTTKTGSMSGKASSSGAKKGDGGQTPALNPMWKDVMRHGFVS